MIGLKVQTNRPRFSLIPPPPRPGKPFDPCLCSGHLLSTAEVESALVEHEAVAEAAVVGRPHPVKGESLYCFVTLNEGLTFSRTLEAQLKQQGAWTREEELLKQLLTSSGDKQDPILQLRWNNHFDLKHVCLCLVSSQWGRRSAPSPHRTSSRTPRDSPRPDQVSLQRNERWGRRVRTIEIFRWTKSNRVTDRAALLLKNSCYRCCITCVNLSNWNWLWLHYYIKIENCNINKFLKVHSGYCSTPPPCLCHHRIPLLSLR